MLVKSPETLNILVYAHAYYSVLMWNKIMGKYSALSVFNIDMEEVIIKIMEKDTVI